MKLEMFAQSVPWDRRVDVWMCERRGERTSRVTSLTFQTVNNEEVAEAWEPSFSMSLTQAQSFMDQLWNCGLRPSEGTGSAGALAATQKHLDDMRKLVFGLLPPSKDA